MRKQQQCGCRWRGKRKLQNSQTATRLEQKCGDGGGAADEGTSEISDIEKLLTVLPDDLSQRVQQRSDCNELIEVVLDLGRPPTARFPTGEISLRDSPLSRYVLIWAAKSMMNAINHSRNSPFLNKKTPYCSQWGK